ncbi:MAG: ammonium transporter [Bacteroidota bacterium]
METEMLVDSTNLLAENIQQVVAVGSATQEAQADVVAEALFTTHNLWLMVCTALVFIMHLGFAGVEAGFTQAKNTVNILFKNTLTPAMGLVSYALIGFSLMYPGTFDLIDGVLGWGGTLGTDEAGVSVDYNGRMTYWTDFLFQAMFAATAATIVSGAVAERIKMSSYLFFSMLFVGLVYPIIGSWKWGEGFLHEAGFIDFAGSTLVHSVGGWGALAGIMLLGPRLGKYAEGRVNDFPGSSVPLATLGVFLLWFGWFGFNGGSVLSADPASTSLVLVNTCLAGATGAFGGMVMANILFKRLDLGMVLNGILAGLVGITAGADLMSPFESMIIGLIAGGLVVLSAVGLDKLKLDDCVGAVSVHLTCGIFGTLAVGMFGAEAGWGQFLTQLQGVAYCGAAAFGAAYGIFFLLKRLTGIRVSPEHEASGLDSHEHGIRGYTIVFDE